MTYVNTTASLRSSVRDGDRLNYIRGRVVCQLEKAHTTRPPFCKSNKTVVLSSEFIQTYCLPPTTAHCVCIFFFFFVIFYADIFSSPSPRFRISSRPARLLLWAFRPLLRNRTAGTYPEDITYLCTYPWTIICEGRLEKEIEESEIKSEERERTPISCVCTRARNVTSCFTLSSLAHIYWMLRVTRVASSGVHRSNFFPPASLYL